jgi:putative ATPase
MREWGYGKDYRYAHDYDDAYVEMSCLPDEVAGAPFYQPSDRGFEQKIAQRMEARGQAREAAVEEEDRAERADDA